MSPCVSVIVPVYAHARYLEECLDSVQAQTHPDIELIVVDDASPDESFAVVSHWLERHAGRFVRPQLLRQPRNAGAHAAINRGLSLASGDYVAILNSDDSYAPQRLSVMLQAMREQGARMAFSSVRPFSPEGVAVHPGFWQLMQFIELVSPSLPSLSFACLAHNCALTTGNFVLERSLAQQVGEFAELPLAHDWDYLLRVCHLSEPLMVRQPLYNYRLHSSNTFHRLAERSAIEREVCVGRYLRQAQRQAACNPQAPHPDNWPGLFEYWLQHWGWQGLWRRLNGLPPSP